ncbi:MAG: hypothetical protein Kow00123_05040 [Anaerolineales bacterium]
MGFWERVLKAVTGGKGVADPMIYWVYVRCEKCGEPLKARVDLRNELSAEFGERREDTVYTTRKVIIGSGRCHAPVEVRLTFDWRRNLLRREISGGAFLTEAEYQAEIGHQNSSGESL